MNLLRNAAVILAIGLAGGETWRSWGAGRPFLLAVSVVGMIASFVLPQTHSAKRGAA